MAATGEQKRAFGKALQGRVTTKAEREALAEQLGVSPEAVRTWTTGERVPDPDVVFTIEKQLKLKSGTLSRHLGYLPLDARDSLSVEAAIAADATINEDGRRYLLAVLRAARG